MGGILKEQTAALSTAVVPDLSQEKDHQKLIQFLRHLLPGAEIHIFGSHLAGNCQNEIAKEMLEKISRHVKDGEAVNAFIVCTGSSAEDFSTGALWNYIYAPEEVTPEKIEKAKLSLQRQINDLD